MKIKLILLALLTIICIDNTYGQRPRKKTATAKTNPKVDLVIQKQMSLLFEAKELKSLISGSTSIRFKTFDNINKDNFKTFKIQDKALEILDSNEITQQNNPDYFYIVGWSDVLNMLNIEIIHQATKTKVKILLTKKNNEWQFGTSELISEKKPETSEKLPAKKSLKRRG